MNRYSIRLLLLILSTGIPVSLSITGTYLSIQDRQNTITAAYTDLILKWEPALQNLTEDTVSAIIKKKKHLLEKYLSASFNDDEQEVLKILIKDIERAPLTFACEELDRDIKTLFALINEARLLNMNSQIDTTPFQSLRAQMDTLPSLLEEQKSSNTLADYYKIALAGVASGLFIGGAYKMFYALPAIQPGT